MNTSTPLYSSPTLPRLATTTTLLCCCPGANLNAAAYTLLTLLILTRFKVLKQEILKQAPAVTLNSLSLIQISLSNLVVWCKMPASVHKPPHK